MYTTETTTIKERYDRFARFYDLSQFLVEKGLFHKIRRATLGDLEGRVLEIGVGTGMNLRYYNPNAELTAIDISQKMLEKAKERAGNLGLHVDFRLMDAQDLEFEDSSFDYVIGTFVLCSIPDPVKALKEIRRVVKEGGKIVFIEHVLSKYWPIALFEHSHNFINRYLFGFNVNRDTRQNIIKSGICITSDENLYFFDVLRRFTCSK